MKKQSLKKDLHYLAFNKGFFERQQNKLLWLLNNKITKRWFKWVLSITKSDIGYDRKIIKIMPNAYVVLGTKEGERVADFRTHPKYAKRLYSAFKPLWWVMHFWDWALADSFLPQWSFGFSTLTAYPDPNPETTTVDGIVQQSYSGGSGVSWATIIAVSSGNAVDDSSSIVAPVFIRSDSGSNNWRAINRGFALFDTSSLTSGATISDATLSLYGDTANSQDSLSITPDINIYGATPASNTELANNDFSQTGSTPFATAIDYSTFNTDAYHDFALNSNGISNISKTGVSKFAIKNANYDVAGSAPTWNSTAISAIFIKNAEASGTSTDPKLVVTYTANTTTTQTQTGLSRIQKTASQTQTGKARITATTQRTQTGVSRITITNTKTQTGVAKIENSVQKNQTGIARITNATTKTQTGKAKISATTTKTITGTAAIVPHLPYQDVYSSHNTNWQDTY